MHVSVLFLLLTLTTTVYGDYVPMNVDIQGICSHQLTALRDFNTPKATTATTATTVHENATKMVDYKDMILKLIPTAMKEPDANDPKKFRKSKYWRLVTDYFEEPELTMYNCDSLKSMSDNMVAKTKHIVSEIKKHHKNYLKDAHNQDHLWAMDYMMKKLWLIIDYQKATNPEFDAKPYKLVKMYRRFKEACECGKTEQFCRVWRRSIQQPSYLSYTDAMKAAVSSCADGKSALYFVQACRMALLNDEEAVAVRAAECFLTRRGITSTTPYTSMHDVRRALTTWTNEKVSTVKAAMSTFNAATDDKVARLRTISEDMEKLRGVLVPPFDEIVVREPAGGKAAEMVKVVRRKFYHLLAAEMCILAHQTFDPKAPKA